MQGSTWAWSVEGVLTRAACADVLAAKVGDLRGEEGGGEGEGEGEGERKTDRWAGRGGAGQDRE